MPKPFSHGLQNGFLGFVQAGSNGNRSTSVAPAPILIGVGV